MKNSKKALFRLCAFWLIFLFFSDSNFAQSNEPTIIYIYRQKKFACSGVDLKISFFDENICKLKNGSKLKYTLYSEGKLILLVTPSYSETTISDYSITLNIKSGQTYYIKVEAILNSSPDVILNPDNALQEFNNISDKDLITINEDLDYPIIPKK